MATNATAYPEYAFLCHKLYALGKKMVDMQVNMSISNTTANAIMDAVKTDRGSKVNTYHTTILSNLSQR